MSNSKKIKEVRNVFKSSRAIYLSVKGRASSTQSYSDMSSFEKSISAMKDNAATVTKKVEDIWGRKFINEL